MSAPYRAVDQRAVPIAIDAGFADGRSVKSVTLVVDENPMPVTAVFRFAARRERVSLGANVRLDQASAMRVIVEASDHRLYMAEAFVKASGLLEIYGKRIGLLIEAMPKLSKVGYLVSRRNWKNSTGDAAREGRYTDRDLVDSGTVGKLPQ